MDTFWLAAGGWWVRAAVAGGGVLLLAWLSAAVFRRPAWRQQVGAWAVRGAVLAAALAALPNWLLLPRPAWMTPPAPADATAEATPEPPAELAEVPSPVEWVTEPQELTLPAAGSSAIEPPSPSIISDSPVSQPAAVVPLLLSAYALVAGVLLLQLVWEWLALTWLLRDSAPLAGRARRVFDRLTAGERPPLALSSARVRSPLCVGYFRPRLVLPKGMADAADEPTLRWVLAHELDHLRRGDTRTACWVGVARAVFFFVPWFWVLRKDLTLCQEYLADAAAAGTGDTPADYAAFLVELSGGRSSRRPLAAARMRAGKSELFRRVHMLLTTQAAVRGATRGFTWLAGTAAVAAAVGLSGLGFADEPKKDEPKPKVKVIEVEKKEGEEKKAAGQPQQLERLLEAVREGKVDDPAFLDLVKQLADGGRVEILKMNDLDVKKLADLTDLLMKDRAGGRVLRLQPPADGVRGGARVAPAESDLRKQYEQQLKEFEERIKRAADAEAKEQLEKARDEYKKAIEEPLKKADAAQKDVDAARRKLEDAERANRDQNAEAFRRLAEMQREMQQRMLDDMRRLDGFGRVERFDPFSPLGRNAAQPRLGLKIEKVSPVLAEQLDLPKDSGVVVADVTPGSAADKAGLKKSDVLLTLAGKDVPTDPEAFTAMVAKLNAGEKYDAVVLRKGKKETVKGIELPEVKRPAARGDFGDFGLRGGGVFGGGGQNESVQIQIQNDEATLQATVGDVGYTVTGTVERGKLTPTKIVVKEGKESKEYDSLEKVPEGQKATVERLLGKVRLFGGR